MNRWKFALLVILLGWFDRYGIAQQTPEQKADAARVKKFQDMSAKLLSAEQEKTAFLADWNKACESRGQRLLWDQAHTIPACMLAPAPPPANAAAVEPPQTATKPPNRERPPLPPPTPRIEVPPPPKPAQ